MLVVGRKREYGAREPNGRLSRRLSNKPDIEPISPALLGRIRAHAKRTGMDVRMASELGRLLLTGEFTIVQTAVGFRIGEIYGKWRSYKRLRDTPKSPSYNASYGEAGISEDLLLPEQIEDLERRIHDAEDAWKNLEAQIPVALRGPIQDLCVLSIPINPTLYDNIRWLFGRFASNWKIHGAVREHEIAGVAVRGRRGRDGPPLHFNQHEAEEEKIKPQLAPPPVKRPNFDRMCFIQVMRKATPHLSDDQIKAIYDIQQALKQRAIFRAGKARMR